MPRDFGMKSMAPKAKASSVIWAPALVEALTMITPAGHFGVSCRKVARPSCTGISTSSVMTSGCSSSAFRTPSAPSQAVPTTVKRASAVISLERAFRMKDELSTTSTRMRSAKM